MTVRPYNPQQAPDDDNLAKEHQNQEARAIQASIKSAKDTTDALSTAATALTTRVTTAEGNITTLQGQMTTANTNIGTLQTTVGELSGRNRLINGDFRVDQRNAGASQNVTAASALAYCLDRWYAYCTGANTTVQQTLVNNKARIRFTGAASVTGVGLGQRIEATNSADLAGQSVVLQSKLSSSSLTSVSWALYYASTTDSFGTLASPTRTLISNGSWTITSTEALYTATISVPSGANTGLELVFTGGALGASQTLTIGDVQLEYGTIVTQFERLQYGTQVALCQRYYQTQPGFNSGTNGFFQAYYGGTNAIHPGIWLPVQMRITPTTNISNASIEYYSYAAVWTGTTLVVNGVTPSLLMLLCASDGDGRGKLLRTGSSGANPAPVVSLSAEL